MSPESACKPMRSRAPSHPATPDPNVPWQLSQLPAATFQHQLGLCRANRLQKAGHPMRCYLCLSHSGGPLGLCAACLDTVYPHGITPWVQSHVFRPMPATVASREQVVLGGVGPG
jgi:hypothetical protein